MGRAVEVISGKVVNASTTFTAWTMATGDSNVVRNFDLSYQATLCDAWAQSATAGLLRVRSPKLHDNVQGIRLGVAAATPQPLFPDEVYQRLYPQDTLTIEQTGGSSETDCGTLLIEYDNLPGADGVWSTWDQLKPLVIEYVTVETQHTTGGTAGDYGGALAINANFDLLKANEWYAILGYLTSAAVNTVGYRSPDFSNYRCGGPGTTQRIDTRDWFLRHALETGRPWIPAFNSANKGSTFVDLQSTATGASVVVQTFMAHLSQRP